MKHTATLAALLAMTTMLPAQTGNYPAYQPAVPNAPSYSGGGIYGGTPGGATDEAFAHTG